MRDHTHAALGTAAYTTASRKTHGNDPACRKQLHDLPSKAVEHVKYRGVTTSVPRVSIVRTRPWRVVAKSSGKFASMSMDSIQQSSRDFSKTETPLAAVIARRERGKHVCFSSYYCRARITGTPHGIKIGLAEDRTGGLGPAKRKEHYLTAAPSHRFDRNNANLRKHMP